MRTSGAGSGRWWVINAAILLVSSYILSACTTEGAAALSQRETAEAPHDNKIITIFLYDDNNVPILNDATVQVEGTEQADTDDDGGYYVDFCITGQYIRAWMTQYEIAREPCQTGKREYHIKLIPLNLNYSTSPNNLINPVYSANGMYSWVSAQNCQGCHSNILEGWTLDGHSKVLTDHFFSTMYTGSDSYNRPGTITEWVLTQSGHKTRANTPTDYGPGYLLDYPNDQGNCVYCHLPALVQSETPTVNPRDIVANFSGDPSSAMTEGITCDICHKAIDVQVGKDALPYSDRPGVLSLLYLFPKDTQQLFLGPSLDANPPPEANAHSMCSAVLSEARFCAACHYGKFFDTVIYNSYGEWLNSSYSQRNDETYRSCQDCHMLSDAQVTGTAIAQRDACSLANTDFHNFSHNMMKYEPVGNQTMPQTVRAALIRDAATLEVEYQYLAESNAIQIKTVVNNVKAGHKFPTDSPLRHLLLVVDVRDEQQNPLALLSGGTIPNWGGVGTNVPGMMNYGGMPGQIFANLLMDVDTNVSPSAAYWNPTQLVSANADTRLNPLEPKEYDYSFIIPNRGKVHINVQLVYRYAFIDLAQKKSWPLSTTYTWSQTDTSDLLVVARKCVVDPNRAEYIECNQ